jgi:hypothetical protein
MRSFGVRLPILAATAWAGIGLSVMGRDLGYSETVYLTPTVTTIALPTSYVTSRSYLVPTAYSFASYIPASYIDEPATLASTSYVTTGYQLRRGLLGRLRLVERPVLARYATTYVPSSYFLPTYYTTSYRAASYTPTTYTPTVYEYPRVWASSYTSRSADCEPVPCDTPVLASSYRNSAAAMSSESAAAPAYTVPRSSNNGAKSDPSGPIYDPTVPFPSNVGPPPDEPEQLSPVKDTAKTNAAEKRAESPPTPPAASREQNTAAPIQPAPASPAPGTQTPAKAAPANAKPTPPPAPGADPVEPELKPAPIDNNGSSRRETLRPVYSTTRTLRPELRNVLIGRVESDAGEPLGEVSVAVERTDNGSIRRTHVTNAFGGFAIRLTDGEWNVNVRMPSGRFYKVRTVTVNNGTIIDNAEQREVRNLIISY